MRIQSMNIRNFRVFREARLDDLPGFAALVGQNGTGKSTLFRVFGFLRNALETNVTVALQKEGGFRDVVSRGATGPIEVELKFRDGDEPLITYSLAIGFESGRAVVEREVLKYRRGQHGKPWHFLDFTRGTGRAIRNEEDYGKPAAKMDRETQALESPDILAIKGLGQFQRFQVVSKFRKLIESWHLSDFHIDAARPSVEAGYAEHLSSRGDNLALVAQYLYQNHRPIFDSILRKMEQRVPGVRLVEAADTVDGRVVLRFHDGAFRDPFIARDVSDGTVKMFAYLVLLNDPAPHPLVCVEEPENQLFPHLLRELAEEFREYSARGGQVFVSTHSPDFLEGVALDEVYWLEKCDGFTTIHRAADFATLRALVDQGDPPGVLWKQGLFRSDLA